MRTNGAVHQQSPEGPVKVRASQRVSTRTPVRLGSSLDRFVVEHYCVTETTFQGRVEVCGHHVDAHDKKTGACLGMHARGSCLCGQLTLAPGARR